jgi:flagellar biosynthesis chaperone FliJ
LWLNTIAPQKMAGGTKGTRKAGSPVGPSPPPKRPKAVLAKSRTPNGAVNKNNAASDNGPPPSLASLHPKGPMAGNKTSNPAGIEDNLFSDDSEDDDEENPVTLLRRRKAELIVAFQKVQDLTNRVKELEEALEEFQNSGHDVQNSGHVSQKVQGLTNRVKQLEEELTNAQNSGHVMEHALVSYKVSQVNLREWTSMKDLCDVPKQIVTTVVGEVFRKIKFASSTVSTWCSDWYLVVHIEVAC